MKFEQLRNSIALMLKRSSTVFKVPFKFNGLSSKKNVLRRHFLLTVKETETLRAVQDRQKKRKEEYKRKFRDGCRKKDLNKVKRIVISSWKLVFFQEKGEIIAGHKSLFGHHSLPKKLVPF